MLIEAEATHKLLGQRSARAFAQNCDFGFQIVAGLKVGFWLVELVDTLVVSSHTDYAVIFDQQFGTRKTIEDGDSSLLDFLPHPLHEAIDGDDVVAVIAQRRR